MIDMENKRKEITFDEYNDKVTSLIRSGKTVAEAITETNHKYCIKG
jgi:hypothetical protein